MMRNRHLPSTRPAFTLLELLVIIMILVLLMSFAVPAFSHVAARAKRVQSLATIRQLGVAFSLYTAEHQMRHPYFAVPGDPNSPYEIHGYDISYPDPGGYFKQNSFLWVSFLKGHGYFNRIPKLDSPFYIAEKYNGEVGWSRYLLTSTAFAAPEYWEGDSMSQELGLLRGTSMTEIRWPSRKGMICDIGDAEFLNPTAGVITHVVVGLADGSTGVRPWTYINPPVRRPYGSFYTFPGMATRGGLQGIDW